MYCVREICEQQPGLFSKEGKKKLAPTTAVSVDAMVSGPPATCIADDTDSDTNDAEMPMDTPSGPSSTFPFTLFISTPISAMLSEMSSGEQDPISAADDGATTSTGDESKEEWNGAAKETTVALDEGKVIQGLTADNVGNATAAELCLIVRNR